MTFVAITDSSPTFYIALPTTNIGISVEKVFIFILFLIMLFASPAMVINYLEKPISGYCDSVTIGMSPKNVTKLADDWGFFIFQKKLPSNGTIVVNAKQSPYFRLACLVDVADGAVVSKRVRSSD